MREHKLFIDGQWGPSSSGTVADNLNPATGEAYAKVHQADEADVKRAIAAAYRARTSWGATLAAQGGNTAEGG